MDGIAYFKVTFVYLKPLLNKSVIFKKNKVSTLRGGCTNVEQFDCGVNLASNPGNHKF